MRQKSDFQQELESWLSEVINDGNSVEGISAFRFGLDEVDDGYVLYLAGHKNYDEVDDEWAAYLPEFITEKELLIASEDQGEKWQEVLLQAIHSLGLILRTSLVKNTFLDNDKPVYTGFVGGDLYRIK